MWEPCLGSLLSLLNMSCLVLFCFLHGLTVRIYRLSPVPVSLVSFPIFPTAPSHSPLLGKVNRPKHSSPFLMVAHCFTIGSNAITFLGRLFYFACVLWRQEPLSRAVLLFLCICWCLHSNEAHACLLRCQIILHFCLFFCACPLPSHPLTPFLFSRGFLAEFSLLNSWFSHCPAFRDFNLKFQFCCMSNGL